MLLSSESEMLTWRSSGLPSDDLTMENVLVIKRASSRTPSSSTLPQPRRHVDESFQESGGAVAVVQAQDLKFHNEVRI